MLKKLPVQPQLEMFKTVLTSFIHPEHKLCLLAKKINWKSLEEEFTPLNGKVGSPSIPTRTIIGLLLLKQMYNLGDETVVEQYEFGNKSSFAYTRKSGIIVGAMAVKGNIYDWRTLKPQPEQLKELTGGKIKKAIGDKGYKVKVSI